MPSDATARRDPTTVGGLLAAAVPALAAVSDTPRLDAEVLLAFAAACGRASLLAFPERTPAATDAERFVRLVERRAHGEPLAYLLGEREFFSLPLQVLPDVLVPRPETELLVEEVLTRCADLERPAVLDVGTGSGAIALAIKHERPAAEVTAVDVSAGALAVAQANGARLGLNVRWLESDWFAALGAERFDAIACNPPYLRADDAALAGALRFEPRLALDGGADGCEAFRAVLAAAGRHLAPHGVLALEHGHEQRRALIELATARGWQIAATRNDLADWPRVLVLRSMQ
jgi:release factor glutamine methyltransferase